MAFVKEEEEEEEDEEEDEEESPLLCCALRLRGMCMYRMKLWIYGFMNLCAVCSVQCAVCSQRLSSAIFLQKYR